MSAFVNVPSFFSSSSSLFFFSPLRNAAEIFCKIILFSPVLECEWGWVQAAGNLYPPPFSQLDFFLSLAHPRTGVEARVLPPFFYTDADT